MAYRHDISFSQQCLQLSAENIAMRILDVASNFMETGVWNGDLIQEWRQSVLAYLNKLEREMQLHLHSEHQRRLQLTVIECFSFETFQTFTMLLWFFLEDACT